MEFWLTFQKQLGSWNNIPTDEVAFFSGGEKPPTRNAMNLGFQQHGIPPARWFIQPDLCAAGIGPEQKKSPPKMKMSPSNIRIWPMNYGIYTAILCTIWIQSKHNQWICLQIGYLNIWQHVHKQSHGVCVVGQSWTFVRFVCWMWNILLGRDDHGSSCGFGKSPWQGVLFQHHMIQLLLGITVKKSFFASFIKMFKIQNPRVCWPTLLIPLYLHGLNMV